MSIREALATYLTARRDAALAAFDLVTELGTEILKPLRMAVPYTLAVATQHYSKALEKRGKPRAAAEMAALSSILTNYVSGYAGMRSPYGVTEAFTKPPTLIPLMVTLQPGERDVEVSAKPSKRCYVYGAKAFMGPGVETSTIRPTLRIEAPCAVSGPTVVCNDDDRLVDGGELDLAYFETDEEFQPFDFGAADPEHPIKFRVTNKTDEIRQVCMVLFSDPIDDDSGIIEVMKARFVPAQMQ